MLNRLFTHWLRYLGHKPCFRIYGKAKAEKDWHVIDVFATSRRDRTSRLPLWRGTCITWTDEVIVIGCDFAEIVLREQMARPASRDFPVEVAGGRLRDALRRAAAGASDQFAPSELIAHECGHTHQVLRFGPAYWFVVGALTLLREGPHWWNHFENDASASGLFGGIVPGSVLPEWMAKVVRSPYA